MLDDDKLKYFAEYEGLDLRDLVYERDNLRRQSSSRETLERLPVIDELIDSFAHTKKALVGVTDALEKAQNDLAQVRRFIAENLEPLRQLAKEVSLDHEPCGYYCSEDVGHVDHKLANWAKFLYTDGVGNYTLPVDLLPEELQPRPSRPGSRF